jgi:hypothetical protein
MRLRSTSIGWVRVLATLLALVGAMLLFCGQAVANEGPEDNPPMIGGGMVTPSTLSHEGGNVQLSAEVTRPVGDNADPRHRANAPAVAALLTGGSRRLAEIRAPAT